MRARSVSVLFIAITPVSTKHCVCQRKYSLNIICGLIGLLFEVRAYILLIFLPQVITAPRTLSNKYLNSMSVTNSPNSMGNKHTDCFLRTGKPHFLCIIPHICSSLFWQYYPIKKSSDELEQGWQADCFCYAISNKFIIDDLSFVLGKILGPYLISV